MPPIMSTAPNRALALGLFILCPLIGFLRAADVADGSLLNHEYKDIGLTLRLPAQWQTMPESQIATMNKQLGRAGMSKTIYLGGLLREPNSIKPSQYATHIFIQSTTTAEALTNNKILEKLSALSQKPAHKRLNILRKKTLTKDGVEKPYLDSKLKIVVLPTSATSGDPKLSPPFVGRTYMFPIKENLVGIIVYCRPEIADQTFAEVEKYLPKMVVAQNVRLPDTP
jgi:hypothetical protein